MCGPGGGADAFHSVGPMTSAEGLCGHVITMSDNMDFYCRIGSLLMQTRTILFIFSCYSRYSFFSSLFCAQFYGHGDLTSSQPLLRTHSPNNSQPLTSLTPRRAQDLNTFSRLTNSIHLHLSPRLTPKQITMASQSIQLSIPLPMSLDTRIYLQLSTKAKALMLFLTTATQDEVATSTPMGSFVYALPNVGPTPRTKPSHRRTNPGQRRGSTLDSHCPQPSSPLNRRSSLQSG